jgi:hypothetical protein
MNKGLIGSIIQPL